jgi:hypothetical protein
MRKKIVIFKTIVVFMSMFLHAVIHFCDGALWSFWMEANLCSFCMLSFIFVMVHCGLFEWKRIFAVVVVICCYLLLSVLSLEIQLSDQWYDPINRFNTAIFCAFRSQDLHLRRHNMSYSFLLLFAQLIDVWLFFFVYMEKNV